MGWKKWPSWLKGGIIGGLVGIFYNILLFLLSITNLGRELLTGVFGLLFKPNKVIVNYWCNTFIFPKCVGDNCGCNISTPSIIFILLLIIIGAIIGWIYRKVKRW